MSNHSGRIVLVGGGVRSGKSRFALERAEALGPRRVFLATAQAFDSEMQERVERHKMERGPGFRTIEEPIQIPEVILQLTDTDVVVVDCLTLWLSNLLMQSEDEEKLEQAVQALVEAIHRRHVSVVLVTNEVGMGVVPESRLGRIFRDAAGKTHQRLAKKADEIFFAMMGIVLRIHPGPVVRYAPPP